jgi:hypothetical protein
MYKVAQTRSRGVIQGMFKSQIVWFRRMHIRPLYDRPLEWPNFADIETIL